MRIRLTYIFIFVLFFMGGFTLSDSHKALAQSSPIEERPQTWVCPAITKYTGSLNPGNLPLGTGVENPRLRIQASNLPTDKDIYIVCGIDTGSDIKFTTGSDSLDESLGFGKKNYTKLHQPRQCYYAYDYSLYIDGPNPRKTPDGKIDVVVSSSSCSVQQHTCMLVYENAPEIIDQNRGNTLQLGTLRFSGSAQSCLTVKQDPYGRVFDAASLKPVPQVNVTLLDQSKAQASIPGTPNPVSTIEDGIFNFLVPAGTYFLKTPLTQTTAHTNASLAYSNLYTYDAAIVEQLGKAEQRDIPVVMPSASQPRLTLINYGQLQLAPKTRLEGRASWPLTIVQVIQGTTTLATQQSDKFGYFSILVDNTSINPTQQLTMQLVEVDLTTDAKNPKTGGATVGKSIDPIPSYLEGYAYDSAGQILPFAAVKVKLTMSDSVYFQTTADKNGFFTIAPRFLPIIGYYLEFTPANTLQNIKVTIPEFAQKNKAYHDTEDIHIIAGTKAGKYVDASIAGEQKKQTDSDTTKQAQNQESQQPTKSPNSPLGFIIMFIVIVIAIVSGYIIIKRRHEEQTDNSSIPPTPITTPPSDSETPSEIPPAQA